VTQAVVLAAELVGIAVAIAVRLFFGFPGAEGSLLAGFRTVAGVLALGEKFLAALFAIANVTPPGLP